jgi:MATE family multidrug resistance protein
VVSSPPSELLVQWQLAIPLAAQQVGLQLMSSVDTGLLGHYSSSSLAGVSVGAGLLFAITCVAMGVLLGMDSVVPRAVGAGDTARAERALLAGLRLAVLISVPTTLLVLCSRWALPLFRIEDAVADEAHGYIAGRAFGILPFLVSVALRSYLAAYGKTRALVVAMIGGNLLNFAGDYLLIFGDAGLARLGLPALGVPELGAFGAAVSTSLVQLATAAIYGVAVAGLRRGQAQPHSLWRTWRLAASGATTEGATEGTKATTAATTATTTAATTAATTTATTAATSTAAPPGELSAIVHHGVPIGLHLLAEVGVFAAAGILAAHFGTTQSAAHSVAITLAGFTFAATLGIGSATAVRVGLALGAGGADAAAVARHRGLVGIGLGAAVMTTSALAFWLLPRQLAGIFTDQPAVIDIAAPLLLIAAFFQLSDGIQAVTAGALRGAGDTRSTMWANLLGHYALALPLALALGFGGLEVTGVWWGLSAGLAFTAAVLVVRFLRLTGGVRRRRAPSQAA